MSKACRPGLSTFGEAILDTVHQTYGPVCDLYMSLMLKPESGQLPIPGSKLKQDLDCIESELQKLAATMPNVNPATRSSPTQYSSWGAGTPGFSFAPPGHTQSHVYSATPFGSTALKRRGKGLKPITGVSSVTQLLLSLKRYTLGENTEVTAIPPDRCGIVSNATDWKES